MRPNRRSSRGNVIRFSITLWIFLLLISVPLLELFGLASGATLLYMAAQDAASSAAKARKYEDCLTAMVSSVNHFVINGTWSKLIKMRPIGGYKGSGADLSVVASSFVGGKINHIGDLNLPVPKSIQIDTSVNVYECTVQLNFQVDPLLNLSAIPLIGAIPGLGAPLILSFSASKTSEYPRGLVDTSP